MNFPIEINVNAINVLYVQNYSYIKIILHIIFFKMSYFANKQQCKLTWNTNQWFAVVTEVPATSSYAHVAGFAQGLAAAVPLFSSTGTTFDHQCEANLTYLSDMESEWEEISNVQVGI